MHTGEFLETDKLEHILRQHAVREFAVIPRPSVIPSEDFSDGE